MTHDELTLRIIELSENDTKDWKLYPALRAVVELHKPHDKYNDVCSGCYEEESGFSDYPCPTIQAIEKEIGL